MPSSRHNSSLSNISFDELATASGLNRHLLTILFTSLMSSFHYRKDRREACNAGQPGLGKKHR